MVLTDRCVSTCSRGICKLCHDSRVGQRSALELEPVNLHMSFTSLKIVPSTNVMQGKTDSSTILVDMDMFFSDTCGRTARVLLSFYRYHQCVRRYTILIRLKSACLKIHVTPSCYISLSS